METRCESKVSGLLQSLKHFARGPEMSRISPPHPVTKVKQALAPVFRARRSAFTDLCRLHVIIQQAARRRSWYSPDPASMLTSTNGRGGEGNGSFINSRSSSFIVHSGAGETGHAQHRGPSRHKCGVLSLELGPSLEPQLPCRDPQPFPGPGHCRHCAKKSQRFSLEGAFWESSSREDISKQFQIIRLEATLREKQVGYGSHLPISLELRKVTLTQHMHI